MKTFKFIALLTVVFASINMPILAIYNPLLSIRAKDVLLSLGCFGASLFTRKIWAQLKDHHTQYHWNKSQIPNTHRIRYPFRNGNNLIPIYIQSNTPVTVVPTYQRGLFSDKPIIRIEKAKDDLPAEIKFTIPHKTSAKDANHIIQFLQSIEEKQIKLQSNISPIYEDNQLERDLDIHFLLIDSIEKTRCNTDRGQYTLALQPHFSKLAKILIAGATLAPLCIRMLRQARQ